MVRDATSLIATLKFYESTHPTIKMCQLRKSCFSENQVVNLGLGKELKFYQFTASTGQRFYFDLIESGWNNADWAVYGPDNSVAVAFGQNASTPDMEMVASKTGTYLLAVRGNSDSRTTHNFKVFAPSIERPNWQLGQVVNNSISKAGERDEYVFQGTAGFKDNYTAYDLGKPVGVSGILGAMAFKRNADGTIDPDTMLVGGGAASGGGVLYSVKVLRGEGGHIIGFDDDLDPQTPYSAEFYASSPYSDAGLVYTPDGVLLANMWSPSGVNAINPGNLPYYTIPVGLGGLTFVPENFPGAGQLKATGKWPSNAFYTVNYSIDGTNPDGTPRYKIDSTNYETNAGFGPGAFVYMPVEAPNFESGYGLVMAEWNVGEIAAYDNK